MPLIQNISLLIYYCLDQTVMFIWLPVTLYTLKVFRFDVCSYLLWIFQEPQDGLLVLILNFKLSYNGAISLKDSISDSTAMGF